MNDKETMRLVADAIHEGFGGEESYLVDETGGITMWFIVNEEILRLHFTLDDKAVVTLDEFKNEYLGIK